MSRNRFYAVGLTVMLVFCQPMTAAAAEPDTAAGQGTAAAADSQPGEFSEILDFIREKWEAAGFDSTVDVEALIAEGEEKLGFVLDEKMKEQLTESAQQMLKEQVTEPIKDAAKTAVEDTAKNFWEDLKQSVISFFRNLFE